MKITKIEIKNFQQFKDFSIDLTYPKGHEKEGKPLEKVCFIGQSGTGKSTILEEIQDTVEDIVESVETDDKSFFKEITKKTKNDSFIISSFDEEDNETVDIYFDKKTFTDKTKVKYKDVEKYILDTDKVLLLLDENISDYNENIKTSPRSEKPIITEKETKDTKNKIDSIIREYEFKKIIISWEILTETGKNKFWHYLLKNLIYYDERLSKINSKFTNKVNDSNFQQLYKELNKWKEVNPNPKEKFAEKVNFFLKKFHVKVDDRITWGGGIELIRTDDTEFPFMFASTGTKRIMLTTLLLFFLDTKNTIVLFDEPENSLYPDVQQELITFYTQLATDAQFFFATHSPIIASQFEACERFILKFDDKGFVKAVRGDAPEGVEPNFILLNDFGLKTVFTPKGEEKWKEFVELKSKIHFEKDEKVKQELMDKYMEIGIKYNFGNNEKNSKR